MDADVVSLDMSIPFTAARARNHGLDRLIEIAPECEYVQFIDGDCAVDPAWFPSATAALDEQQDVVVVFGGRHEQFPRATVYNRLCDMEWDVPVGEANACGGDAMMRIAAVRSVKGYLPELIAGEEPEMCVRLRANGGRILRISTEMTRHDAAMTRLGQWWMRHVRAGYAFAQVSWLHRHSQFGIWRRETRSSWFWGLVLPFVIAVLAPFTWGLSLILLAAYPVLVWRIYRHRRRRRGDDPSSARLYAVYCMLSKFPQALGQCRYWWNRVAGRRERLIEYKGQQVSG